jgi:hypothetical protein
MSSSAETPNLLLPYMMATQAHGKVAAIEAISAPGALVQRDEEAGAGVSPAGAQLNRMGGL